MAYPDQTSRGPIAELHSGSASTVRDSCQAASPATARTHALVEWEMAPPPAPGAPRHRHRDVDEGCYVLTGKLTLEIEGSRVAKLPLGDFGLIPKGKWHTLGNPRPEPARFLVIVSPPGFEGYWAEQADRMARKGGPLDPKEVVESQTKYKMGPRRRRPPLRVGQR